MGFPLNAHARERERERRQTAQLDPRQPATLVRMSHEHTQFANILEGSAYLLEASRTRRNQLLASV